jgi:hypothetical protein
MSNEQTEKEIRKTIPFIIAPRYNKMPKNKLNLGGKNWKTWKRPPIIDGKN